MSVESCIKEIREHVLTTIRDYCENNIEEFEGYSTAIFYGDLFGSDLYRIRKTKPLLNRAKSCSIEFDNLIFDLQFLLCAVAHNSYDLKGRITIIVEDGVVKIEDNDIEQGN